MLRRRHLPLAVGALAAVAAACLIFDGKVADVNDEGGTGDASDRDAREEDAAKRDARSENDAASEGAEDSPESDGGHETSPGDAGSTPVTCGPKLTCYGGEKCCASKPGGAWMYYGCAPREVDGSGTHVCGSHYGYECDDGDDCDAGMVCCAGHGTGGTGPYSYTLCTSGTCSSKELTLCPLGEGKTCPSKTMCKQVPDDLPPGYESCQ